MLRKILRTRKLSIHVQIDSLEKLIASFPAGELHCIKNGKYVKWFLNDGNTQTYIPRKNRKLAECLALKKMYSSRLQKLRFQSNLIEKYLSEYNSHDSGMAYNLTNVKEYQELLKPYLDSHPDYISKWLQSDYIRNPSHPESLIHQTLAGHLVRSKSEVMIANMLYQNKIPYIYERGLSLDTNIFFPDFTICHPLTFEIYYWEHFGMMDNQSYCEHAYNKLKIYSYHKIVPTINLITTYENLKHPINSMQIEQLIQEYFL